MEPIANEKTVLVSDDSAITLTNLRIIYKTNEVRQEIFLKDIISCKVVKKKRIELLITFIILGCLLFLRLRNPEHVDSAFDFILLFGGVLVLSLFFYFEKINLNVTGKYNTIEFSVRNLSKESLSAFLNKISILTDNLKA